MGVFGASVLVFGKEDFGLRAQGLGWGSSDRIACGLRLRDLGLRVKFSAEGREYFE